MFTFAWSKAISYKLPKESGAELPFPLPLSTSNIGEWATGEASRALVEAMQRAL